MRPRRDLAALALLFISVTLGTCIYPTERDSSVHVSVTRLKILIRGRDTTAKAAAWQIVAPGDSQRIPNVTFVWSSTNPAVATVDNTGRIVGVNSGTVVIRAAARNFDQGSLAGVDTLRVSAPLEIDSVLPATVKYGEKLTIFGVGVDSIFATSLSGAALIHVPFSDTTFKSGTARTRYWVPPPAHTDSLFFLGIQNGNGVFGKFHDTTVVIEHDLYYPNTINPRRLSLDGPVPFPNTPYTFLLFFNPALAFEALPRGVTTGADWFRFGQSAANVGRDLTFIVESPELAGTFSTFLSDSLGWSSTRGYFIGHDSWTFGPTSHACHGLGFSPSEATADSTIVAFKGLAVDSLDAIAVYTQPGRYGLVVDSGYISELPPDKHEDDNSCNAADLRGTVPAPTYRDTLTIENPHDIDWIRFHYTNQGLGTTAQVRMHAFPGTNPDSVKDLDLYVIKVPLSTDTSISIVAADTSAGSDGNVTPSLATGDYYLVIVDFAGAATTYEVCVGYVPLLSPGTCTAAWPAPPASTSPTTRLRRAAAAGARSRFVPSRRP
jgi:Big-like domain-containing protein